MSKPRILLFADWFEPGFKAGGPIRSCVHFAWQMKDDYQLYIFTSDRDLNASAPYATVELNKWISYTENVQLFYCSPSLLSWKHIRAQITQLKPDFVYLNSMFSRYFTIYPLLMAKRKVFSGKVILSPRGMLKDSALQFKSRKKNLFLSIFRSLNLHKLVHFHATDKTEQEDIRKVFGNNVKLSLAPNFPGVIPAYPGSIEKREGELAIIFVGRIHPVKNLDFLLTLLPQVKGAVSLTIAGSEEDSAYTDKCKAIIAGFPSTITIQFKGEVPPNELTGLLARHHIFALPTRGENFGHAIFEALVAGKPVVISDQTPWRNLAAAKAGWDISLQNDVAFITAIQQAVDVSQQQYNEWSLAAWQFVKQFVETADLKSAYKKIFS